MYKPGRHIYLAAPFFNDEQRDLCDYVESLESDFVPVYSPRNDGGVLTPDSDNAHREEVFESNCRAIESSAWVLAVIDNFDAGVIWEMGYAYAKGIPTLGYSDVEGRGLNVMLAGSCRLGFVNGRGALDQIFGVIGVGFEDPFPYNTWRGQIQ